MERNSNHAFAQNRTPERKRLQLALSMTLVILIAEAIGGLLSGSLALISDAGHMLTDGVSLFLSFLALRYAATPRTDKYTFGLKRLEVLAALLNGILLLFICAYIGYEAVQRFLHPPQIHIPLMLGIALIGLGANIFCAMILSHSDNLNVRSAFLHVVGDLLSSVGVVIGGIIMLIWHIYWIDPALSIVIAAIVLLSGYRVIREATGVLLEAAPDDVDVSSIRQRLEQFDFIQNVHDLHVWTITSGLHSLSCHVTLAEAVELNSDQALKEMNLVLKKEFSIEHATIQIESKKFNQVDEPCVDCEES